MFFLTISPTSVISSDPNNFFSTTIKIAIDQLSYHWFQFVIWDIRISQEIKCGIEIALFLEFNFLCLDDTLLWTGQNIFTQAYYWDLKL